MSESKESNSHDKPCTLCGTPRQVLVRCQIDESGKWHFVCPGKCWTSVSGGVEDAKGFEKEHPYYRYGGMWKNKHADGPVSAKKPKKVKERQKRKLKTKQSDAATEADAKSSSEADTADSEDEATEGAAVSSAPHEA